jgi:glycosyltransferase involved in cell wall biosynthesis
MRISVIIPTHNKAPRLRLTLLTLANQDYPHDQAEVIIVDDGSTDDTAEVVRSMSLPFAKRYCRQPQQGRSCARNCGLNIASGEIVVFVDDDLLLPNQFLQGHERTEPDKSDVVIHGVIFELPYLKFFHDPTTGELIRQFDDRKERVRGLMEKTISIADIVPALSPKIKAQRRMSRLEKDIQQILSRPDWCDISWIACTGGNVSMPRQRVKDVGGFDEQMGLAWGLEDMELGFRLLIDGCRFVLGCRAENYHMSHYRKDPLRLHAKAAEYFSRKHGCRSALLFQDYLARRMKTIEEYAKAAATETGRFS